MQNLVPRSQRNKELHNSINKAIAQERQKMIYENHENTFLTKLLEIDRKYFEEKIREFDDKYQFDRPYLDVDRSKKIMPDDLSYSLRNLVSTLEGISTKNSKSKRIYEAQDDKMPVKLTNQRFVKYMKNLDNIIQRTEHDLIASRNAASKRAPILNNISKTTVLTIRNNDDREMKQMLKEVDEKTLAAANEVYSKYKNYKWSMTFVMWLLPVLIVIMLICIIVPIFI